MGSTEYRTEEKERGRERKKALQPAGDVDILVPIGLRADLRW